MKNTVAVVSRKESYAFNTRVCVHRGTERESKRACRLGRPRNAGVENNPRLQTARQAQGFVDSTSGALQASAGDSELRVITKVHTRESRSDAELRFGRQS